MISTPSYRKALFSAIGLHVFLIILLVTDTSTKHPALTKEVQNSPGLELPMASAPKEQIVKAVSLDNKQVMETVNRLKQERAQQQQAEANRQRELNRQLEAAKQQRLQEQKQLAKLKEEANRIAIARKKQVEEEKKHLKELAEQKAKETKRMEELKKQNEQLVKQREQEAKKLAELNKKKAEEKAKAEKLRIEKELADKKAQVAKANAEAKAKADADKARAAEQAKANAKADAERKSQAAAAARANAENQARIAGEVDKYKALIVNAIGRNWILPENVNSSLSCQFRIRLAPDGAVLEVSLTRGSGDPLLDRSAQTAIYKASPLPVPTDSETFGMFRDISLTVRPEQVRG